MNQRHGDFRSPALPLSYPSIYSRYWHGDRPNDQRTLCSTTLIPPSRRDHRSKKNTFFQASCFVSLLPHCTMEKLDGVLWGSYSLTPLFRGAIVDNSELDLNQHTSVIGLLYIKLSEHIEPPNQQSGSNLLYFAYQAAEKRVKAQ